MEWPYKAQIFPSYTSKRCLSDLEISSIISFSPNFSHSARRHVSNQSYEPNHNYPTQVHTATVHDEEHAILNDLLDQYLDPYLYLTRASLQKCIHEFCFFCRISGSFGQSFNIYSVTTFFSNNYLI
jgi:hypothetical protein